MERYSQERRATLDDIEDSGKERDGYFLSIRYEKELLGGVLYAEVSYNEEDDDREVYDFERSQFSIGYSYKF